MAKAQAPKDGKLDLFKANRTDYATPRQPCLLEITPAKYLAIDGRGAPGGEEFMARIGALYSMAFTIKMMRKFAGRGDYKVCALEATWWAEGADANFSLVPKDHWCWQLLIRTPDFIRAADLKRAQGELKRKGKSPLVREVALNPLAEGRCVQVLHVGPYSAVEESIGLMRECAHAQGLVFHGRHHEIYLSDPRRVPPERLRTILRMPVHPADD